MLGRVKLLTHTTAKSYISRSFSGFTTVKHIKRRIWHLPEMLLPTAPAISKTRSELNGLHFLVGICISSDFIINSLLDLTRCGQASELQV
jgi:hypothetical protein